MRPARFSLSVAALVLVLTALAVPPAQAASDRVFTRYDQSVVIAQDGTAAVTMTVDLDFSRDSGHGPVFTFITRMDLPGTDLYRVIEITDFAVSSPTGANTEVQSENARYTVTYQIGSDRQTYRDTQTYLMTYTIRGLVEPNQAVSGLDEFNWNAIGTSGDIAIVNPTVRLSGPGLPSRVACFQGKDLRTPCQTSQDGAAISYSAGTLAAGEGMQVTAGFPAGSFVGAEPELRQRLTFAKAFPLNACNLGGAGAVTLAGVGAVLAAKRRRGCDLVYDGLTPGNVPTDAASATRRPGRFDAVAVAFAPPAGVSPGEGLALQKGRASNDAIGATVIDLAVRGYLSIEDISQDNWLLRRTEKPSEDLASYELGVLAAFFKKKTEVSTKKAAKSTATGKGIGKALAELIKQVVDQRGWFTSNPQVFKGAWVGLGLVVLVLGVGAAIGLAFGGLAGIGVGLAVVGLVLVAVGFTVSNRTADGSAVLAQINGFKEYISTAEADQLKWEAGQDIFSAYLPWAMVFGQSERWTALFQQLAEQGRYTSSVDWYTSPGGVVTWSTFNSQISHLASGVSSMVASASSYAASGESAAAGGGSGFSGGGGFGGGGASSW